MWTSDWRRRLGILLAASMIWTATNVTASGKPDTHPAITENRWQVIAHRGGNRLWPGNTMHAFRHAVELGVDVLEMDVHQTSDGVLVVIHDDTVDRTTNGTGYVKDMTLAELQALDAGYNWPYHEETSEHPFRGKGIRIPTLEEVLSAFPEIPMIIEIKQADPSITDAFGSMLRRFDRAENTIVASFHSEVMADFRESFPEFATAGTEPEIRRYLILSRIFLGWLTNPKANVFQVPEKSGNLTVVTPRFVRTTGRKGVDVHVWTINDRDDMVRLLDYGIAGIMTDRPDVLLEVLGR